MATTAIVTPPTPSVDDDNGSSHSRHRGLSSASVSFADDLPRPRSSTVAANEPLPGQAGVRRSSSFNRSRSASAPIKAPPVGPLLSVPYADSSTTSLASTINSSASHVSPKRQVEFEKHFAEELKAHAGGDIPEDFLEVIQTQSADLQVSVLLHGRLYLTRYHLCFRSNILGIVTMKVHPLKDLVGLEKGTTAKWIQNAVQVWVDETNSPHSHHSHHSHHSPSPSPTKQKNGDSSRPNTPKESSTPSGPGGKYYGYGSMADRDAMYADLAEMWSLRAPEKSRAYFDSKGAPSGLSEGSDSSHEQEDGVDGASVNTATPEVKKKKIKNTKCSGEHYKEVALDTKIAVGMEELFELLYQNEKFHLKFLKENQKLTDIVVNDWESDGPGKKERSMTYVMHMHNPLGPSKSDCNGNEAIVKYDLENAIEVMSETQTPDVPSGKNFKIHTRTCLTHTSLDGKPATRMYCTTQCDWSSSSLLKGTITPAVIKGQKEYHKQLVGAIQEWIKEHPDDFGKAGHEEEVKAVDVEEVEAIETGKSEKGVESRPSPPRRLSSSSGKMAYEDMTLVDCAVEIWRNPLMRWITIMCGVSMALNWWYILH